jgi:hypothetical protein
MMARDRKFYDNYVLAVVDRGEDVFERADRKGLPYEQINTSVWKLLDEEKIVADRDWNISLVQA